MSKVEILVPLLNANEPEARLVGIHVKDGQAVEKGALLFTLETTKVTSEIDAPEAGFIRILAAQDAILLVGDRIAYVVNSIDELVEISPIEDLVLPLKGSLRITKPASALAASLGVDLGSLPVGRLVTEKDVRQAAGVVEKMDFILPSSEKPYLLIFGGGGHAKSVMDMVKQIGTYAIAGILDDDVLLTGTQVLGIPVLGTRALFPFLIGRGVKLAANGVGGIVDINVRVKIFESLQSGGFSFPALVHPRATIESSAEMGDGVQVFANAYVGSDAILAPKCMVNTNAVVSHDCIIGEFSHIAPGALLAGHVHVGARTLVGMGVTTAIGVKIGDGVRVGNGANLLTDVPDRTIIQAGRFWTGKAGMP
jgi:sugar O-acyltransferase (sialic acid O-acetyltransferase NeuD family)